jgi:hypothetical protein
MPVSADPTKTGISRSPHLLCASAVVSMSVTGTLTETALATCTIPAGAMGLNGGVMIYSTWTVTNSANNKTTRIRLGGIGGTAHNDTVWTTIATVPDARRIRNRNSASSQVGSTAAASGGGFSTTSGAVVTSSVDTTAAVDLVFTGQLANTGETITLESYEVWLLPG